MEIKISLTKDNIKILQNIKEDNPNISFKVFMKDKLININFSRIEITEAHYLSIYDNFIEDINKALLDVNVHYRTQLNDTIYIIEEVQEKKILLTLSIDNTVALEELKLKYTEKTQGEILNELISTGLIHYKE